MNINMNLLKKNEVFFINLSISVFIFLLVYIFFYSQYSSEFKSKKDIYDKFDAINMKLEGFAQIEQGIEQNKKKINEITSLYEGYFVSNADIINNHKAMLIKLFNNSEIPLKKESVVQVSDNDSIKLLFKFDAPYEQFYKLLFDIEKISKVSNISMNKNGEISMECRPHLYSAPVSDFFSGRENDIRDEVASSGYFEEISGKILNSMNVGRILSLKDLLPIPRNPFYHESLANKSEETGKTKKSKGTVFRNLPPIVLDGIMYEEKNPIVIIEGKLYHKGQTYRKMKIVKINQSSVEVEYYGKVYSIKMQIN